MKCAHLTFSARNEWLFDMLDYTAVHPNAKKMAKKNTIEDLFRIFF